MKVQFKLSDFPMRVRIALVLIQPFSARTSYQQFPRAPGSYILFKAYFPAVEDERVFDLLLPTAPLQLALRAVPRSILDNLRVNDLKLEIMRCERGKIQIRKCEVLLSGPLSPRLKNIGWENVVEYPRGLNKFTFSKR